MGLSRLDPGRVNAALIDELREEMLKADPRELILIRSVLKPRGESLRDGLWSIEVDPYVDPGRGFRAACALAEFDPQGSRWNERGVDVAARLLSLEGTRLDAWVEALRPVRDILRPFLEKTFVDPARSDRFTASTVLAAFADEPEQLVSLIDHPETDPRQLKTLLPRLREFDHGRLIGLFEERLAKLSKRSRIDVSTQRRAAHLALVLLSLDQAEPAWHILRLTPDPEARSTLIHAFAPADIDPLLLIRRLDAESDVSARRALILALGEYDILPLVRRFPRDRHDAFRDRLAKLYRDDPDPGLHAAVAWLARRWGMDDTIRTIDREMVSDAADGNRDWYVNRDGLSFAVVRGPVEFVASESPPHPLLAIRRGGCAFRARLRSVSTRSTKPSFSASSRIAPR